MSAIRWLAQYAPFGQVAFRIGRIDDDVVAEWAGVARLQARSDGTEVRFEALPGARPIDLAKLERGSARLLIRHLQRKIALHGSAVGLGSGAVIFLGRSGEGKSTLAAALCAFSGATLFADDAIAIDPASPDASRWLVAPMETDHWLDAGAAHALGLATTAPGGEKMPVRTARPAEAHVPLVAFVDLVFDADAREPRLSEIGGMEALAALVPQAVRFIVDEPARQREEVEMLTRLASGVPTFRLERPRDLALLRPTVELAAALLHELVP